MRSGCPTFDLLRFGFLYHWVLLVFSCHRLDSLSYVYQLLRAHMRRRSLVSGVHARCACLCEPIVCEPTTVFSLPFSVQFRALFSVQLSWQFSVRFSVQFNGQISVLFGAQSLCQMYLSQQQCLVCSSVCILVCSLVCSLVYSFVCINLPAITFKCVQLACNWTISGQYVVCVQCTMHNACAMHNACSPLV